MTLIPLDDVLAEWPDPWWKCAECGGLDFHGSRRHHPSGDGRWRCGVCLQRAGLV